MSDANFKIRLANLIVEIENPNAYLIDKCKNYIVSAENTDIFISKISKNEIAEEREVAIKQRELDHLSNIEFSDNYLEYINIYRKIADITPKFGIILMHAAAVSVENKAYMFLAKSGVGKTTHIMNWVKAIPGTAIINGDKPLVDTNNMTVCGTPWAGKENLNKNIQVPLAGICILERGQTNQVLKITSWDAVKSINDQTYWPIDSKMRRKTLQMLDKLKEIPCYRLICTPEIISAKIAYEAMSKN